MDRREYDVMYMEAQDQSVKIIADFMRRWHRRELANAQRNLAAMQAMREFEQQPAPPMPDMPAMPGMDEEAGFSPADMLFAPEIGPEPEEEI